MPTMHHRKYLNYNRDIICIITIKLVTNISASETAETSNCMTATETVTCIIAKERSTNITVAESNTCIIVIEPQNLHNCNRHCHLYN